MSPKKKLVEICHKVYSKGFVAAYDGNISCRLDDNKFLITRSGICKGDVTEKDIVKIDSNGKLLEGKSKISTEYKIHLNVYKIRNDVNAVVHCHPVYATAISLLGKGLLEHYLPEVMLTLGKIPLCKFAAPSTSDVPESMNPYINFSWAMLLENHGAVTLGKTLDDAYYKMEKLEHYSKILLLAKLSGTPRRLSKKNINDILRISESTYGIKIDKRNN
ncbi:MAG: class II aldolase/adducin family protein [Ignavibacterium sp.]|jgi:L-fuculose-phosphate aldolase|nr:class II aldolase/adducin family protein [Ignavibacterium sp.]